MCNYILTLYIIQFEKPHNYIQKLHQNVAHDCCLVSSFYVFYCQTVALIHPTGVGQLTLEYKLVYNKCWDGSSIICPHPVNCVSYGIASYTVTNKPHKRIYYCGLSFDIEFFADVIWWKPKIYIGQANVSCTN